MKVVKDSQGSKLLRKKREPENIGITKYERNNILRAIQENGSAELEKNSIDNAIKFAWLLLQRAEQEWESLQDTHETLVGCLEGDVKVEDDSPKRGRTRPKSLAFSSLCEKVDGHRKNFVLLTKFSQLLKDLGGLLEKRESINEKKLQQEYIKITQHSAILDAYVKCMLLAMMEAGIDSEKKLEVVKRFRKVYSEFPIITEDLQSIHNRLFGTPEQVIDIEAYELRDTTPDLHPTEAKDLVSQRLR